MVGLTVDILPADGVAARVELNSALWALLTIVLLGKGRGLGFFRVIKRGLRGLLGRLGYI